VLIAFVTSNLVTAGLVFVATAIVVYNVGRRDERAAYQHQRASSAAVRGHLADLAVKAAAQPVRCVPDALKDHKHAGELRLKPIRKTASMGRNRCPH
jgi:hypothetical protein